MTSKISFYINLILIIGLIGIYILHFAKPENKIAYVDSAKLLNGYSNMLDARKEYEKKAKVWQANIDTLVAGVQNQLKSYEKGSQKMSEKERKLSMELIRNKQTQLANYQKAIQETAQQEDARMTQQVVTQVNSFLDQYGKEHNYDIILVATQSGNIAYAMEGMDITEEVLTQLNQEYKFSNK